MTLFSMLAKLTLDSSQFNSALEEAQSDAESVKLRVAAGVRSFKKLDGGVYFNKTYTVLLI